jgi:excinuclease ABC subunit A
VDRFISISGARTHNLAAISLKIPRDALSVVTGVSGSGKSSLVFDTLYAEGQRRYVQSMSTYARMFLERMDRPDVESISEIPPALALRQKNSIKNARSTVGTVTEIADYLRLMFATIGKTICRTCAIEVRRDSVESAAAAILAAPGIYMITGSFDAGSRSAADAARYLIENGYHRLWIDGAVAQTAGLPANPPTAAGPLTVVLDRIVTTAETAPARVREALEGAFYLGGGRASAIRVERTEAGEIVPVRTLSFDRRFNCSRCGVAYAEPAPALFSANSPIGACPECEGFGRTVELDLDKVIPNHALSIRQGMVAPWRTPAYREMNAWMLKLARRRKIRTTAPFREMTEEERGWLLDGEREPGEDWNEDKWPGVRGFFKWMEGRRYKTHVRILLAKYRRFVVCPRCNGAKLKADALCVRVAESTIAQVSAMAVRDIPRWLDVVASDRDASARAVTVIRELRARCGYLTEVGLGYLSLDRQARTLSGGEAQRIHLASALGSILVGTLYALDEPTVGLHPTDSRRLLGVLGRLRDFGNTVVVVEHDPTMIAGADHVIELGPGGGSAGGRVIFEGAPAGVRFESAVLTPPRVLLMRSLAREKRLTSRDPAIRIFRAAEHNLRGVNVVFPLGRMTCVTGVSGSGKSTLVENVLFENWRRRIGDSAAEPGACDHIEGFEHVGDIVHMGQELPTRSMRSNPATYLKIYDDIRRIFATSPEARRLGVTPRDFSFNVTGGRCEKCRGTGTVTIEMHFMADVEVKCDACDGRRFQSHILSIRHHRLNINQVLDLTVEEARSFFAGRASIQKRLNALDAVGLGYIRIGQTTSTLSGGEAQRLKLARFLLADLEPMPRGDNGQPLRRVFILDEPTTGLSSTDVRRLLKVLARLVAEGNTLIVIEHNMELVAHADYVIDLGPGGGMDGGKVVASGSPVRVASAEKSATAVELRRAFELPARSKHPRKTMRRAANS